MNITGIIRNTLGFTEKINISVRMITIGSMKNFHIIPKSMANKELSKKLLVIKIHTLADFMNAVNPDTINAIH